VAAACLETSLGIAYKPQQQQQQQQQQLCNMYGLWTVCWQLAVVAV
jgi:hypothetical protein